jgi:hypothetical protein
MIPMLLVLLVDELSPCSNLPIAKMNKQSFWKTSAGGQQGGPLMQSWAEEYFIIMCPQATPLMTDKT